MRFSESKSVRSLITMRPHSGRTMPAIAFTIVDFPEPDRPKSATMGASLRNAASSVNDPRRAATSTSSMARIRRVAPAREPLGESQRRKRQHDGEDRKAQRLRVAAGHLRVRVDRERQGARLARYVRHERDRRAELAQRPREGEQGARDDA